jgi:uncharacterized membrane protein YecN with MAPEG domain
MRAQANYIEHAPFFLILLAGLEISGASRTGLASIAAAFVVARILHGLGMDSREGQRLRSLGMIGSSIAMLALTVWALACVVGLALGS